MLACWKTFGTGAHFKLTSSSYNFNDEGYSFRRTQQSTITPQSINVLQGYQAWHHEPSLFFSRHFHKRQEEKIPLNESDFQSIPQHCSSSTIKNKIRPRKTHPKTKPAGCGPTFQHTRPQRLKTGISQLDEKSANRIHTIARPFTSADRDSAFRILLAVEKRTAEFSSNFYWSTFPPALGEKRIDCMILKHTLREKCQIEFPFSPPLSFCMSMFFPDYKVTCADIFHLLLQWLFYGRKEPRKTIRNNCRHRLICSRICPCNFLLSESLWIIHYFKYSIFIISYAVMLIPCLISIIYPWCRRRKHVKTFLSCGPGMTFSCESWSHFS